MNKRVKYQKLSLITFFLFVAISLSIGKNSYDFNYLPDYEQSPYTGYTRDHWLNITEQIIAGIMPYIDKESGLPNMDNTLGEPFFNEVRGVKENEKHRALERIMMAVVIYTTATGKDNVPGYDGSISAPFIRAFCKGVDPEDSKYWGDPEPNAQVGSVYALAVYLNPDLFWKPLSEKQKNNLLRFFQKHSYNKAYNNNHHFFHMTPVPLLESNGYNSNREHLDNMFERLLGWYRGDGWYIDGSNQSFDKYNLWGFQLYMQVLIRFDEKWKNQYKSKIDSLTNRFFETLSYFYGRDGGPIPWGRSLTYRFAGISAIAWSVLNENCPLSPGQARRIASGELKYFWEHGCLGENGVLNIGYWSENAAVAESYINVGDPYWAMHGLACLLIPASDPFWTAKEEAIPADAAGGKLEIRGAQMTVRVSPVDGEARLFPVGQPFKHGRNKWQTGLKYDQDAYSSYLGFCLTGEKGEDLGAGRTGYSIDGTNWFYREHARFISCTEDHLVSTYSIKPDPKYEITTHTLVGNEGEVYVFMHNYPEPVFLYKGGYSIRCDRKEDMEILQNNKQQTIKAGNYNSNLLSLSSIKGCFECKYLHPQQGWSHSHLFGGHGVFPYWQSEKPVPPNVPVIIYAHGTRAREITKPDIQLVHTDRELKIRFEGKWFTIEKNF